MASTEGAVISLEYASEVLELPEPELGVCRAEFLEHLGEHLSEVEDCGYVTRDGVLAFRPTGHHKFVVVRVTGC